MDLVIIVMVIKALVNLMLVLMDRYAESGDDESMESMVLMNLML